VNCAFSGSATLAGAEDSLPEASVVEVRLLPAG